MEIVHLDSRFAEYESANQTTIDRIPRISTEQTAVAFDPDGLLVGNRTADRWFARLGLPAELLLRPRYRDLQQG